MPAVLCQALALFCFCLAIHILIWRIFPLRHQGIRLGLIFLFGVPPIPAMYTLAAHLAPDRFQTPDWPSWGLACLLHFSLAGAYMILYTGVTGHSPSIGILERVDESMPNGLKRSELPPPWFTDNHLSGARRQNLLATGFIYECEGTLYLTPRGRLIAMSFLIFRRLLGLPDVAKG